MSLYQLSVLNKYLATQDAEEVDNVIDHMVYAVYDLTKEEIEIV
jgi:hypothetical protein